MSNAESVFETVHGWLNDSKTIIPARTVRFRALVLVVILIKMYNIDEALISIIENGTCLLKT